MGFFSKIEEILNWIVFIAIAIVGILLVIGGFMTCANDDDYESITEEEIECVAPEPEEIEYEEPEYEEPEPEEIEYEEVDDIIEPSEEETQKTDEDYEERFKRYIKLKREGMLQKKREKERREKEEREKKKASEPTRVYYPPGTHPPFGTWWGPEDVPLPSGGYSTTYDNDYNSNSSYSGTSSSSKQWRTVYNEKPCPTCQGTGECTVCHGLGYTYGFSGQQIPCSNCEYNCNGRCSTCHGKGTVTVSEQVYE